MTFRQTDNKGRICPRCKQRRLLGGEQSKFNAKSESGLQICTECKLEEIKGGYLD